MIAAFNKNKPINTFLLEQMAGDQLVNYKTGMRPTPDQIEPLTATGFLRTTADITDNQTIYEVDKYFDACNKGEWKRVCQQRWASRSAAPAATTISLIRSCREIITS